MKTFREHLKNTSYDAYKKRNQEKEYDGDEETHGSSGSGFTGTEKRTEKLKKETPNQ